MRCIKLLTKGGSMRVVINKAKILCIVFIKKPDVIGRGYATA